MIAFKALEADDIEFLKDMLYLSIYFHPGEVVLRKSIIEKPELAKYYENWGRKDDRGIIVTSNDDPVGAVWCRIWTGERKGWGYVDNGTPELGIALKEDHRGQRLGTQLIRRLIAELKEAGFRQVSLSVDGRNRVMGLYKKIGFKVMGFDGKSYTMIYDLRT